MISRENVIAFGKFTPAVCGMHVLLAINGYSNPLIKRGKLKGS